MLNEACDAPKDLVECYDYGFIHEGNFVCINYIFHEATSTPRRFQ